MGKKLWKNVVCMGMVCLVVVCTALVSPSVEVIDYDDEAVVTPFYITGPKRPKG